METNNLLNEMAKDGAKEKANNSSDENKLSELTSLCRAMQMAEKNLEEAEEVVKLAKETLFNYQNIRIPDLFDEMGLSQIKLTDGSKVEVRRSFAASISEKNKLSCFNWLIANGHSDIIKHDLTIKLKKGEDEEYEKIKSSLEEVGATYTDKEHIHPATLKAFVKEQIENNVDIPQEAFGVFPIRKTSIK